ncbi:TPA: LOW QUALITY PROTEIN: hypothetical protein N0F65_005429 [Lagenidium giganteum]|uniref:HAT C-terminal dimerisation domain-containing protein n=1 Tax=Lagenidium giganteum TaxID=4803 RepID=A0AAV2YXZ9_9STRA|nr:TPA: LOW QUALITY PROTEIN: hypothetical protein N0F65_005429 [Lagenidium giganteum]
MLELNHPLSELPSIPSKTLKAYTQDVVRVVGDQIDQKIDDHFGLIFDAWTHGSMHYGVHAMSPLDDGSETLAVHVQMMNNVLRLYGKTPADVRFVVGDNTNTNQEKSRGVPKQHRHRDRGRDSVVRLQQEDPLTAEANVVLESFPLSPSRYKSTDFANTALENAHRRRITIYSTTCYASLLLNVPPTRNRCERLFSQFKLVLTQLRESMHPANFEMLTFLPRE